MGTCLGDATHKSWRDRCPPYKATLYIFILTHSGNQIQKQNIHKFVRRTRVELKSYV